MLGFVVREINISDNVKKIADLQNKNLDAKIQGNLKMVCKVKNCEMYKCTYQIEQRELELKHIFSDFSNIVD